MCYCSLLGAGSPPPEVFDLSDKRWREWPSVTVCSAICSAASLDPQRCLWPEWAWPLGPTELSNWVKNVLNETFTSVRHSSSHTVHLNLSLVHHLMSLKLLFKHKLFLDHNILGFFPHHWCFSCLLTCSIKAICLFGPFLIQASVLYYHQNCHSTFISCPDPVRALPHLTSHTVNDMNGQ